jgi:uncharacterized protein
MNVEEKRAELLRRYKEVHDVLAHPKFSDLKAQERHFTTNTYDHSIRTAHMSTRLARVFKISENDTAVAALLHDFCDRPKILEKHVEKSWIANSCYMFWHPDEASQEAAKAFSLSREQINAIESHMFPFTVHMPRSRMAFVISIADKLVTPVDFFEGLAIRFRTKRMIAPVM